MRQWSARVLAFTLLLSGARAGFSQPPAVHRIDCAQWVRFEVVLGRITAVSPYCCQNRQVGTDELGQPRSESLCITSDREHASIAYELIDSRQQLRAEITGGDQIQIRRVSSDETLLPSLEFTQINQGLQLELARADLRQAYTAPTLWHLFLAHPRICQQHLLPVLHQLRTDWQLDAQAARVQDTLLHLTTGWESDESALNQLIDQLASESYPVREAADRQLRRRGFSILAFLDRLDRSRMDTEQRTRVRRIRESLHVESGDTPQRIALWLIEDKPIWLTLLGHEQLDVRRLAAGHLDRLCKEPIDFDPSADGPQRDAQIKHLATLLSRPVR